MAARGLRTAMKIQCSPRRKTTFISIQACKRYDTGEIWKGKKDILRKKRFNFMTLKNYIILNFFPQFDLV